MRLYKIPILILGLIVLSSFVSADLNYTISDDTNTFSVNGDTNYDGVNFQVGIHNTLGNARAYILANFSNVSASSWGSVILKAYVDDITGVDAAHNVSFYYCNDYFNESNITWNNQDAEVTNCNATRFYYRVQSDILINTWYSFNASLSPEVRSEGDGIFTIKMVVDPEGGVIRRRWQFTATEYVADVSLRPYFLVNYSAPLLPDNINLSTQSYPIDNSNLSFDTIKFNVTGNFSNATGTSCKLWFNTTGVNQSSTINAGTDKVVNWTVTLDDNSYKWWINCSDNLSSENTTRYDLWIDSIVPTLSVSSELSSNLSIVYPRENFISWINVSDLNLYALNITIGDNIIFNITGITDVNYNFSMNVTPSIMRSYGLDVGTNTLTIETSDSHTDNLIPDYSYTKNPLSKAITYWFDDGYIKIEPETKGLFSGFDTYKRTDRYVFEYKKDFLTKFIYGGDITFKVTSNAKFDVLEDSEYTAHLVNYPLKKWIDFDNNQSDRYLVQQINDYEILVTIYNLTEDTILFNSLGGLNIIRQNYSFYYGNFTSIFTNKSIETSTTTFILNFTKNVSFVGDINATLYYNGTNVSTTEVDFGTYVTFTASNESNLLLDDYGFNETFGFYWNYSIKNIGGGNDLNNVTNTTNQTVYKMVVGNCSGIDDNLTRNFTFKSTYDDSDVIATSESSWLIWYASQSINRTYGMIHIYESYNAFCVYPRFGNFTSNYKLIFSNSSGFDSTDYIQNNEIVDNNSQQIVIYMTPSTNSTAITITVVDEDDNPLVGYTVEANRYDLVDNNYTLIETKTTNALGKCAMNLDVSTDEYQFIVKNDLGEIVHTQAKQLLTETSYTLRVMLEPTPISIEIELQNLDYTLTAIEAQNNFTLSWNDNTGLIDSIRLKVTMTNITHDTTLNSESSAADTGLLWYNVTSDSGIYIGYAYVIATTDGNEYYLDSVTIDNRAEYDVFGDDALLYVFLFIGTMMFIGIAISAEAALILSLVGVIFFFILGFINVGLGALAGLVTSGIIILVKLYRGYR